MSEYSPLIGYASMNDDVQPQSYRTCRKENISNTKLKELIEHNLGVLEATLDYNIKHRNRMFRVSSSLIPFGSSDLNTLDWVNSFSKDFERLRNKINVHKIRISMHPGQYTVLNSPDQKVINNAIQDLEYHTTLINLLAPISSSKIIIHVGGVYGDKVSAIERFINVYNHQLDSEIKQYLVIENDDRLYTVEDVLEIHKHTGVPVVFDNLHHTINSSLSHLSISEIINRVVDTWHGSRPKFHYSQQHKLKRMGAHSDTIIMNDFIEDYKNIYSKHDVDIMLEVKDKNRSFIKINQYFNPSQEVLQSEWLRYKHLVMSKSKDVHDDISRLFLGDKGVDPVAFYEMIDSLLYLDSHPSLEIDALNDIWKDIHPVSNQKEQDLYFTYLKQEDIKKLKQHLKRLANKYSIKHIVESYYF